MLPRARMQLALIGLVRYWGGLLHDAEWSKYYPAHPLDLVSTIRSVGDRKPCRPSFLDQVAFRDLDRGSGRAVPIVPINI